MKKIWYKIKNLFNFEKYKLDKDLKNFAKTEYKQDADFAYYWMKRNPGKMLQYRDRY